MSADNPLKPIFRIISIVVLVVGPIITVCILGTMITAYIRGEWRFSHDVKITDFSICEGEDPITGKPHGQKRVISRTDDVLYVCGNLTSEVPVNLRIYLFYGPSDRAILGIPAYDTEPGYFYQPISISKENALGTYQLEVHHHHRSTISTTVFEIIDP